MSDFATINDVITLFRALTPEETGKAESLLPIVSAKLRVYAKSIGKDLAQMTADDPDLALVAKQVTVGIVGRMINENTNDAAATQISESAGGYSQSYTPVSQGDLFIKNSEYAALGLRRQQVRQVELQ